NVVDDRGMRLPHVVRGSEHLSTTPRQFLMYEAFGWEPPRGAHLPVLLGVDRKKLSKRHGDTSVRDYARLGYLPEALVNFFALMGWYPEDGRELFTVPELIERFRIEEMGKSAAVFDIQKLNWMNGVYMQAVYRQNPDRVIDLVVASLKDEHLLNGEVSAEVRAYVGRVVAILGERLRLPRDVVTYGDFFFRDVEYDPQAVQKVLSGPGVTALLRRARAALGALPVWSLASIDATVRGAAAESGVAAKDVIHPLRVAARKAQPNIGPAVLVEEHRVHLSAALRADQGGVADLVGGLRFTRSLLMAGVLPAPRVHEAMVSHGPCVDTHPPGLIQWGGSGPT